MTVAAFIGSDVDLSEQLLWATRFALLRKQPLLLVQAVHKKGAQDRTVEIDLTAEPEKDEPEAVATVRKLVEESDDLRFVATEEVPAKESEAEPETRVPVRMKTLHYGDSPVQTIIAEVRATKIELLMGVRRELETDTPLAQARRDLFRHAPCELAFIRIGAKEGRPCTKLLVPIGHGPHSKVALRWARDFSGVPDTEVTVLRVNRDIGVDALVVGEHSLDTIMRRALGKDTGEIRRKVVVDSTPLRGISSVAEKADQDVIIIGASKLGVLGQKLLGTVGGKLMRNVPQPTIVIVRAANPLRSQVGRAVEATLQRLVPQMDRESRIGLVERVQPTSQFDFDYVALMTLSSLIAAIGLVQSSAAVVIGAMLVAPLMTPILGLGIALVQGNPVFTRITVRSIALGFTVALVASTAVGFFSQFGAYEEPTPEMMARGGPGLLDLFVAFVSGVAAAYASSRPNLLAAIPGVAIAAALVPPIATAGLALSIGEWRLAFGATLLFVINTFCIALAAQVSLWAVGLRRIKQKSKATALMGRAVIVAVLFLAVLLSIAPPRYESDVLPNPMVLADDIKEVLRDEHVEFKLKRIDMSHDASGFEVIVRVTVDEDVRKRVPTELSDTVRYLVRSRFDQPVQVRVVTQYEFHYEDELDGAFGEESQPTQKEAENEKAK